MPSHSPNFFKPKKYTPEKWGEVFQEYIEDRKSKVWNRKEPIKSGDMAGTVMDVPTHLPLSIESFCVFAGVVKDTFYNYESKKNYEEYFDITTRMREIIEADQLEGSMIGRYNQSIVARKLGLADKKEVEGNISIEQITGMNVK